MTDDRVVMRDGQLVRMTEAELDGLMHVAFDTACWTALRQLGVDSEGDSGLIDSIGAGGEFGNDRISVVVKLKDGREATATAPLWPDATRAN